MRRKHIVNALAIFALVLFMPSRLHANCGADSAHWAWLHPAYNGITWQRSIDTIISDIPAELCVAPVLQVAFTGTKTLSYCAVQTSTGILLSRADYFGRLSRCDMPLVAYNTPVALPQSSGIGVWYLFRQTTTTIDTVLLVIADVTPRVFVRHIKAADGALIKTDTLTLATPPAGASITGITGTSEIAGQGDAGVIIFGTRGLLRRINRTTGNWQAEQSFDIAASQNITAVCDSFAATASGSIYRRAGAAFTLQASPVSSALRAITRSAGVGDNGAIVIRSTAGGWAAYTRGSASYRHFNLTRLPSGSAIELLDSAWRYSSYVYNNTPTRMASVAPALMSSYLNGPVYDYKAQKPETLTVNLGDPDSNFSMPAVIYNGVVDFRKKGTSTLGNAQPALACSVGTVQLADSRIQILMKPDSVILLASAHIGAFDPSCLWNYWSRQTFRNGERWSNGAQLTIKLPTDSVRLRNNVGMVTTINRCTSTNRTIATFARDATGLRLTLSSPGDNSVRTVRVFDPAGRMLLNKHLSIRTVTIALDPASATSMLYVQLIMTDGTTRLLPLPLVK